MVDVTRDNPLQASADPRGRPARAGSGIRSVLRGIDLQVPRGQTLAIIGESGCGKTVLLKAMIGLIRPTQGQVHFDDQDLAALNDRQLSQQRLRFGFVFQNAALFDSMTVGQNVAFPLRQQGVYAAGGHRAGGPGPPGGSRTARFRGQQETGRTVGRDAQTRGHRPRVGHESRTDVVRRADHRPRSHHG